MSTAMEGDKLRLGQQVLEYCVDAGSIRNDVIIRTLCRTWGKVVWRWYKYKGGYPHG